MFPKSGNMAGMLKQAQQMQAKMAKAQAELADLLVEGQSGGGMVTVTANGKKDIISIKIAEEILEEDIEMVEDLILVAVNQALQNADSAAEEKMNAAAGGMLGNLKIPGM